ncbi:hypothetical protein K8Q94_03565 [Candidatus Nomurabacteria bacterium]|nr:hypothetical protein [Candidatus Nomurabacteria bacterium]
MDTPRDLLDIEIEKAKNNLPSSTKEAIARIDWKNEILKFKSDGYNVDQLDNLETEVELLLCGLSNPTEFPNKLSENMNISNAKANDLTNSLNERIFKPIRMALMEINQKPETTQNKMETPIGRINMSNTYMPKVEIKKEDTNILNKAGIEILSENKELNSGLTTPEIPNKFTAPFQSTIKKTEYSLNNISKNTSNPSVQTNIKPKIDPYREIPE